MTTQEYRHIAIAIDRKFIRGWNAEADDDDEDDDAHDLMSAHSTKIAVQRYARLGGLTRSLSPESISVFRSISDKWQKFYRLKPRKPVELGTDTAIVLSTTSQLPVKEKIRAALRQLYGPTAKFRTEEQEAAVEAVVEGISPLFVILPTGAGKSLTFLIPAMFSDAGTTVVILPLVALAEDMLYRCKDAGIDCIIYGRVQLRSATIILVVTESAISGSFGQAILDIHLRGRLDRIVFDEIHKLVMDVGFRPKLEDLKDLALPVQYIFMTATFPPSLIDKFNNSMLIENPTFIRQVNHKPRVRYNVKRFGGRSGIRDMRAEVIRMTTMCQGLEKVLVFCGTRDMCDKLAQSLECDVYYSDSLDKRGTLERWKSGVLCATGALGAGVDIDGIKFVVHFGKPYGMINFDQEVGRGGRGGELVKSMIMILDHDYLELLEQDPRTFGIDDSVMREFIITEGCRRGIISGYVNGDEEMVDCGMLSGELCDGCLRSGSQSRELKRRREEDERAVNELKKARGLEERQQLLQVAKIDESQRIMEATITQRWLQGKCCVCWLVDGCIEKGHETRHCPLWKREVGESFVVFRAGYLGYRNKVSCYKCGLPGDVCGTYSSKEKCTDDDVVLPIGLMGYVCERLGLKGKIELLAERGFKDVFEYCRWMTDKRRVLGKNGSNGFAVYEMIVKDRER
jgi:superfamily II DNA helicase RecQ